MSLFKALSAHLGEGWYSARMEESLETAVYEWIDRQKSAGSEPPNSPPLNGYQWKHLFLPEGTYLRTIIDGCSYQAVVEGGSIMCDGLPVSPSQFANLTGPHRRSAWRTLWVLFPRTSEWKAANSLRG